MVRSMYKIPATVTLLGALLLSCMQVQARDVRVLAPELPPMMDSSGKGREATLIQETLGACGHSVTFRVVPFTRHWADYKGDTSRSDAVATVPAGMDMPGFASTEYIQYQNGASVLKSAGLAVSKLEDLKGKRVVTFAGGKDILPGVKEALPGFVDFREVADQLIHSNTLFAKRVDAVLGDGLIFAEYNRILQNKAKAGEKLPFDPAQDVVFTAIFPPSTYHMVFRDEVLRDDFNRCFETLKKSGRIDAINRAVVEPFRATVGTQYLGY